MYIHKAAAVATQAADKEKQNNQASNTRQHRDIHTDIKYQISNIR